MLKIGNATVIIRDTVMRVATASASEWLLNLML